MLIEKGIDALGKSSIIAIPVSEAAKKIGWVIDVDTFQLISAVGVVALIIDRTIRLIWDMKDRKAREADKKQQ